ncbi:hypothetical protein [Marinilabilia rubra]|uniref:Uncharacterized protein n=1 Tax=Marinilabilia rubra TaxID=2162893 RepID=A0A2U2B508_9BACT|nr:hypothetical protein [Marinilabilia rubra]PWD98142.1 hypothetical protein DDZ16_16745 [Marinilabilia rubra]
MQTTQNTSLSKHLAYEYTSFDRVVLRGYIQGLFVEGSVINLLRNLGFKEHSNGVMRILTDKFNSHIKKTSEKLEIPIHWWGEKEKKTYHSKIDFIQAQYRTSLLKLNKKSKVIAIIRATENVRTFANKEIKTKEGKPFTKMYSVNKFVSQYYIYIDDEKLGLCYLKLSSYLPFVSEFYFNGHNYLKKQFDLMGLEYTMKENSFTKISDINELNSLVSDFKPSIAIDRINHWMDIFFRFNQGRKSTRSKLLHHKWFSYQTEICTNLILKSPKFANAYFEKILAKHQTIGLPDKLTEIFSLSRQKANSKSTQNKFKTKAVIKHWLEGNSIKCHNKSGCLLRVETIINKPDLPGLKLKKPAINLMAYLWYGLGCNSRYIETIQDIDLSVLNKEAYLKYQVPVLNKNGVKIAAPDLRKEHQVEFLEVLLSSSHRSLGFRNKDLRQVLGKNWKTAKIAFELRKLRERGAVKKLQSSHYYKLTKESYIWIFYSFFQTKHLSKPLLSASYRKVDFINSNKASIIKGAYSDINRAVALIKSEFKLVS